MKSKPITLYRPVGLTEMKLIFESGLKEYPPRLPEQPIFYPVLNIEYARQIAFAWNKKADPFAGFVTEFDISEAYISQFERRVVGNRLHEELWVPAESQEAFNEQIIGHIRMVDAQFGSAYKGYIGEKASLKEKDAITQFVLIANTIDYSLMDVSCEIGVNKTAIYLNYPFWEEHDFSDESIGDEIKQKTLEIIRLIWESSNSGIPLGVAKK